MQILLVFLWLLISFFSIGCSKKNQSPFFPPEWSTKHQSIWLAWPVTEIIKGKPAWNVHLYLIQILSEKGIRVDLLVQDSLEESFVLKKLKERQISSKHVRFFLIPHTDIWMRDMGPIFLKEKSGVLKVVDFRFNDWGYSPISKDESVDTEIAKMLGLESIPSSFFSEGGGWDVNLQGVMLTSESVQFQRNPNKTRLEIENEYKRVLGIKRIIWLPEGLPEDELSFKGVLPGRIFTAITTGGHVDEFVRFLSDDTILLGEVSEEEARDSPILKKSRSVLERAHEILLNERNEDGKPFHIVRMPMPEPILVTMQKGDGTFDALSTLPFQDGTVIQPDEKINVILAASYINYLVTNDLVIMAKYYKEGRSEKILEKDKIAKAILQKAYPDKEIIQIDVDILNAGGGGIHCITQQMPSGSG